MLTWLYVPGDRPDRYAKALSSGADAVIVDLEDAVVPSRRPHARDAVAELLSSSPDVPVYVRLSALSGPELDNDLAAVTGRPGLAGLRLPKVRTPDDVRRVAARVDAPLHCVIESAAGVEAAFAIATAAPGVASIGLGEADLASDLGITDEAGFAWARGRVVIAAGAAGLPPPAMSVYADVADRDGLAASCARGRALGLFGRTAIHPRQLPVIVAAFLPSVPEATRAREVISALAGAEANATGVVVTSDGRFADRAMLAQARRIVALADRYNIG